MKMPCLLVMYRHQIQTGVSLKEYLLAQVTKKHTVSLSLGLAGSRFSDVYIRKDSLFLLPAISLSLSPPPPRLRRASRRRDPPYPRPAEPTLEMVGSKCQLGTPAASLSTADSPSQHRAMPPGPSSRADVSGFCFPMEPGSGTKRA